MKYIYENVSPQEPTDRWPWNLVCSIRFLSTTKTIKNDDLGLTLNVFTARSNMGKWYYIGFLGKF